MVLRSSTGTRLRFDYLLVGRNIPVVSGCRVITIANTGEKLIEAFEEPPNYSQVYMSDQAAIFELR